MPFYEFKKKINSPSIYYAVIIFIPFFLYLLTISPTIYWRDSPEFINVAFTLGISHPAGSPAYSTISKLFTFLPFSSLAFKINLVSLFFALLTIIFVYKIVQLLLCLYYPAIPKKEINLIVILCSLLLTIMPAFWLKAIVAEVYTMNAFFLLVVLYLLFQWFIKNDFRYVLLAAFLYGISSGVHAGVVLFLPGIFIFLLLQLNRKCREHCAIEKNKKSINKSPLKSFTFLCFFFLLGFSIYLYLPIRSIANPEFDWGNPETLNNFLSHISDRKDAESHFKNITHIGSMLKDGSSLIKMAISEITFIGLFLSVLGMIINIRKDWRHFLLLFLIALINLLFYLTTTFGVYKNTILFVPSLIILIIWVGLGICFIRNTDFKLFNHISFRKLSAPVILIFVFFSLLTNYQKIEKSNYYLTEKIIKETYFDLRPNSILFSHPHWFLNRYMQDVENLRPDLTIIHIRDMSNPDFFNPVTQNRYPMLEFPAIASTKDNFIKFWPLFVKENAGKKKMYTDFSHLITGVDGIYLVPYKKFLMQIVNQEEEKKFDQIADEYYQNLQISMNEDMSQDIFFLDQKEGVKTYYKIFLINFANHLRLKGKYAKALAFITLAESLSAEKIISLIQMKGICLAELGRYNESVSIFNNLLKEYPDDKFILTNLGNLYFKKSEYKTAEKYLRKAIRIDNTFYEAHFILGMIYSNENRMTESVFEIKKAIALTDDPIKRKKMGNYLKKILKKDNA